MVKTKRMWTVSFLAVVLIVSACGSDEPELSVTASDAASESSDAPESDGHELFAVTDDPVAPADVTDPLSAEELGACDTGSAEVDEGDIVEYQIGPLEFVTEWVTVGSAEGEDLGEYLSGLPVVYVSETSPLVDISEMLEASASVFLNRDFSGPAVQLWDSQLRWATITSQRTHIRELHLGLRGADAISHVNVVAAVLTSGQVAFIGNCAFELYTQPLSVVAADRGETLADVVAAMAAGDESVLRDGNDVWNQLNSIDEVAWEWIDQPPELRSVDPTVTPSEFIDGLSVATVFVELNQAWSELDAFVCLRQAGVGVFECMDTNLASDGTQHIWAIAYYDPNKPIELWLTGDEVEIEARARQLSDTLGRAPTAEEYTAANVSADYARLAVIDPTLLQTLSDEAGLVLDLDPASTADIATLVGAEETVDVSADIYLPDHRVGDVTELHEELCFDCAGDS